MRAALHHLAGDPGLARAAAGGGRGGVVAVVVAGVLVVVVVVGAVVRVVVAGVGAVARVPGVSLVRGVIDDSHGASLRPLSTIYPYPLYVYEMVRDVGHAGVTSSVPPSHSPAAS